jgi:uncharacterized protein YjbJ (UPF0337 family)
MTEHQKADQARKGLVDSVKGKAKEVVGALTGNDSLTAEGQLEQTQAHARKEANSVEAVADAEAEQARGQAAEARIEGARERSAVNAETAVTEQAIQTQKKAQQVAADQSARQQATAAKVEADLEVQRAAQRAKAEEGREVSDAAGEIAEAVAEHQTAHRLTANAHEEADRIRRRAADLTDDAELP